MMDTDAKLDDLEHHIQPAQEALLWAEGRIAELEAEKAAAWAARVKPIAVWTQPTESNRDCPYDHCTAKVGASIYQIEWKSWKNHDDRTIMLDGNCVGGASTLELAKAAADADHIARITLLLEPDPRVAALVDAATAMYRAVCGPTGFVTAVRHNSGLAYPWPSFDDAEPALKSALAAFKEDKP